MKNLKVTNPRRLDISSVDSGITPLGGKTEILSPLSVNRFHGFTRTVHVTPGTGLP